MQLLKAKTGKIIHHASNPDFQGDVGVCPCGKGRLIPKIDQETAQATVEKGGSYCPATLSRMAEEVNAQPDLLPPTHPDGQHRQRDLQVEVYAGGHGTTKGVTGPVEVVHESLSEQGESLLQSFLATLAARQAEREKKRAARAKAKEEARDPRLNPVLFHMPQGDGQRWRRRNARRSVGVTGASLRTQQARPHTKGNKPRASLYTHRAFVSQEGIMGITALGAGLDTIRPARPRDRAALAAMATKRERREAMA